MIDAALRAIITEAVRDALRAELPKHLASAPANAVPAAPEVAVSPARAGELTGFSAETVLNHINAGHLRAHKPAGSREWRILVDDLRRWVAAAGETPVGLDAKGEAGKIVAGLRPAGGGRR